MAGPLALEPLEEEAWESESWAERPGMSCGREPEAVLVTKPLTQSPGLPAASSVHGGLQTPASGAGLTFS